MELIRINKDSLTVKDGIDEMTESFVAYQNTLQRKMIITQFPNFPWELRDKRKASLEEMYQERSSEVREIKESRKIIKKDEDFNSLSHNSAYRRIEED